MARFRKKPVEVDAMRIPDGDDQSAVRRVAEWMVDNGYENPENATVDDVDESYVHGGNVLPDYGENYLEIETLEGVMHARPGDWIIKGVAGEFYPCKPDIFGATYEPVSAGE